MSQTDESKSIMIMLISIYNLKKIFHVQWIKPEQKNDANNLYEKINK